MALGQLGQISILALFSFLILILCYQLIKIVLKRELKKSLPEQIKIIRDLMGDEEMEIVILIDKFGKMEIKGIDIKQKIEYTG